MAEASWTVETRRGPARILLDPAPRHRGTLILGHGASGGASARDLTALARALPDHGWDVVRVEQPWRVAGRRVAAPAEHLDEAWLAAVADVARARDVRGPLVVGGRSAGARVACRTARTSGADAVVALAFPLHPPWRPERSRRAELLAAGVPVLVVQGECDGFGAPEDFGPGPYDLVAVPDADHGFSATQAAGGEARALERVVAAVTAWLARRA